MAHSHASWLFPHYFYTPCSVETQQKGGIRTDGAVKPCCSGGGNAAAEQTEEQESKPSCCGGKNGTKEKETASVFEFMRYDCF